MFSEAFLAQLKIRPGEAKKVAIMALFLLLAVSAFIIGRITRDSLFLSQWDREHLVLMYITVAFAVSIPSFFYARVADRYRRDKSLVISLLFVIVSLGVFRALMYVFQGTPTQKWIYAILYNWTECIGTITMIQFWTFAGDIFSSRQAKRLFPIIGGGGVLANIVCGASVSSMVTYIGTENLLYPLMGCFAVCAYIAFYVGQKEKGKLREAILGLRNRTEEKKFNLRAELGEVFNSKHLKVIAAMTVATHITVQFIDFQFKTFTKSAFTQEIMVGEVLKSVTDTTALSSFYGLFFTCLGIVAAIMQFAITGRVLERFGIVVGLMILPLALFTGSIGMLVGVSVYAIGVTKATFAISVLNKGAENSLRYSIYDATMQVIYMPVPGHIRGRAKSFIDGILKPASVGFAGLTMWLLVAQFGVEVHRLSIAAAALSVLWLFLVLRIRKEYVSQLMASLRKRRLDFSKDQLVITDDKTVQILRKAISNAPNTAELRNALVLVARVQGHDLSDELLPLLESEDQDIRIEVLRLIGSSQRFRHISQVQQMFKDPVDEVRAAAIGAYGALMGESAMRVVKHYLDSQSTVVRAAAITTLIAHGGLDGILASSDYLKQMLESDEEDRRFVAATILRDIGVKNFFQPVMRLMRDPSMRVQIRAIEAAGNMQSPELIPILIYKLGQTETARTAHLALSRFGNAVVEVLGKVLTHTEEEYAVRRHIPRILLRIGTQQCFDVLLRSLAQDNLMLNRECARCAGRLRDKLMLPPPVEAIQKHLHDEMKKCYQLLAALEDLENLPDIEAAHFLRETIDEKMALHMDLIFKLLTVTHQPKSIDLIQANLLSQNQTTQANATEVLDNLLEKDNKKLLLPLLEDLPRDKKLEYCKDDYKLKRQSSDDWISDFLMYGSEWLMISSSFLAGKLGEARFLNQVQKLLQHPHAIVRETAIQACQMLLPAEDLKPFLEKMTQDRGPSVRSLALHLLGRSEKDLVLTPNPSNP